MHPYLLQRCKEDTVQKTDGNGPQTSAYMGRPRVNYLRGITPWIEVGLVRELVALAPKGSLRLAEFARIEDKSDRGAPVLEDGSLEALGDRFDVGFPSEIPDSTSERFFLPRATSSQSLRPFCHPSFASSITVSSATSTRSSGNPYFPFISSSSSFFCRSSFFCSLNERRNREDNM
jgi:hypothetical protein